MDGSRFDRLTRRASFLTLGAAGLAGVAALASPVTAESRKKNKKKKADVNKLCKTQVGVWTSYITIECEGKINCLDALDCAARLGTCDFDGFWSCFIAASNP